MSWENKPADANMEESNPYGYFLQQLIFNMHYPIQTGEVNMDRERHCYEIQNAQLALFEFHTLMSSKMWRDIHIFLALIREKRVL